MPYKEQNWGKIPLIDTFNSLECTSILETMYLFTRILT